MLAEATTTSRNSLRAGSPPRMAMAPKSQITVSSLSRSVGCYPQQPTIAGLSSDSANEIRSDIVVHERREGSAAARCTQRQREESLHTHLRTFPAREGFGQL